MNDEHEYPSATYRLQFNRGFTFNDALSLVPYLSRLGVTHVYSSPVLRARRDSTHGYDVVDPATVNPNLGDEANLREFITVLHNYGLGLVLDIVPNHMAASIENPYWRDVLTYGPHSPFARWFDIDWRMPDPELWGRVLVPVLGEPLRRVLAADQIRLAWSEGRFILQYFEHVFPVEPSTVPEICSFGMTALESLLEAGHPALGQMRDILERLAQLPTLHARVRRENVVSRDEIENWLSQLAQLIEQSPRIRQWAQETADRFGGDEGHRRLRKLLKAQPYRLVYWREAARVINYRRFFDINDLISVRQEDPHVFEETHALIRRWLHDGLLSGLRIDHIDGLRDPLVYLQRLRQMIDEEKPDHKRVSVFVEKILAPEETLCEDWPVAGTTGYDFLNQVESLFLSFEGFQEIEQQYRRMLRRSVTFQRVAMWGKRRVLRDDLSPHVGRIADILLRIAESEPQYTHLTKGQMVDAIVETTTALPVYRTYIDDRAFLTEPDRNVLQGALHTARNSDRCAPEAVQFLQDVLLLASFDQLPESQRHERLGAIQRWQQLTGPAAAKGIEDTALYVYVPLVSRNEVGAEPDLPLDHAVADFHAANKRRAEKHPAAMLSATTHDTKRSADVRARLDVLTELPRLWWGLLRRWQKKNRIHRKRVGGKLAPAVAAEYLFYQTIVGIWPAVHPQHADDGFPDGPTLVQLRQRLEEYMLKAVREAKTRTSWVRGNSEYEDALIAFIRSLFLMENNDTSFLQDVHHFVCRIARPGFWNSLSRTLVQLTAPGTPDIYQGDELWNFVLVDPDNRQPVDFACRQRLLDEAVTKMESTRDIRHEYLTQLLQHAEDGRIKLHVIRTVLNTRREYPHVFASGRYLPLQVHGAHREHLVAFARATNDRAIIVVAPRLTTGLVEHAADAPCGATVWADTSIELPAHLQNHNWVSLLTREELPASASPTLNAADALNHFPAGLLLCAPEPVQSG